MSQGNPFFYNLSDRQVDLQSLPTSQSFKARTQVHQKMFCLKINVENGRERHRTSTSGLHMHKHLYIQHTYKFKREGTQKHAATSQSLKQKRKSSLCPKVE